MSTSDLELQEAENYPCGIAGTGGSAPDLTAEPVVIDYETYAAPGALAICSVASVCPQSSRTSTRSAERTDHAGAGGEDSL